MKVARSRLLMLSLGGVLGSAAPASAATVNFAYTGAEQTFTVPAGVTSLHVVAIGGHGAQGGQPGGNGAQVTTDLPVTPGRTLFVEVGGNGSGVGTGASAFNGGGAGANGCCGADGSNSGAGGGGTDLRLTARTQPGTLGSRLVVAGGGGGGGGYGGGAGGAADSNGTNGFAAGIIAGGAGSALAPGAGGAGAYNGGPGANGLPGVGGAGGAGNSSGAGGGGGGGYYGGGGGGGGGGVPLNVQGGGTGAGGGGGGSYVLPGVPATFATTGSAPSLSITYTVPAAPGAPAAASSTSAIAFAGPQTVGTLSGTVPVRVINNGSADLVLSSVAVDGPNADDFLADSGNCLAPIAPQASCTVRIRFAPLAAGSRVATLVVDSNDVTGSLLVGLSGTAAALQAAPRGPQGPAGPAGAQGPKGDPGPAAKLPLVTCKTKKKKTTCTTTLAQLAGGKATLFRAGKAVASGTVSRGRVKLVARRRLAAGTYALRVVKGKREQRVAVAVSGTR